MSSDPKTNTPPRPRSQQPPADPTRTGEQPAAEREQPDPTPRDDYERDNPAERAGLRRPRGGTPNVAR